MKQELAWTNSKQELTWTNSKAGVDGANVAKLANNDSGDFEAAFAPDGSKIASGSDRIVNGEIWVMNADGSQPANPSNSISSDGSRFRSVDGRNYWFLCSGV